MKSLALLCFASASLFAQTMDARFDAVSVKASPPNDGQFSRGCNGGPWYRRSQ